MLKSGLPNLNHDTVMVATAPAAAERNVFIAMRAMEPSPVVVEPGLNPNQPTKRMNTPSAASVRLWPGIG
jgi:hypothetical protein